FDNLLRNALTYASSGGWVGIRLAVAEEEIRVSVADRGPGGFSADLERLFEPFFRGSSVPGKNGHGLGLAIAQRIVRNHHGRIAAENRPEGGLCLTVSLPKVLPESSGPAD
ncbi:MAG: sensor histidine kinase, partial [Hyphomicrobiaceae bacterium]